MSRGDVVAVVTRHIHAMYWYMWWGMPGCTQGCMPDQGHAGVGWLCGICRRHVGVHMCVGYMTCHVGRGDAARGVCCHAHVALGGCGGAYRAACRVHGLHRAMCGAVTVCHLQAPRGCSHDIVCVVRTMISESCRCSTAISRVGTSIST